MTEAMRGLRVLADCGAVFSYKRGSKLEATVLAGWATRKTTTLLGRVIDVYRLSIPRERAINILASAA